MVDAMHHLNDLVYEIWGSCITQNILCEFGSDNSAQIEDTLSFLVKNVPLLPVQKEIANLMFEILEEVGDQRVYIRMKRMFLEEFLTDGL